MAGATAACEVWEDLACFCSPGMQHKSQRRPASVSATTSVEQPCSELTLPPCALLPRREQPTEHRSLSLGGHTSAACRGARLHPPGVFDRGPRASSPEARRCCGRRADRQVSLSAPPGSVSSSTPPNSSLLLESGLLSVSDVSGTEREAQASVSPGCPCHLRDTRT